MQRRSLRDRLVPEQTPNRPPHASAATPKTLALLTLGNDNTFQCSARFALPNAAPRILPVLRHTRKHNPHRPIAHALRGIRILHRVLPQTRPRRRRHRHRGAHGTAAARAAQALAAHLARQRRCAPRAPRGPSAPVAVAAAASARVRVVPAWPAAAHAHVSLCVLFAANARAAKGAVGDDAVVACRARAARAGW